MTGRLGALENADRERAELRERVSALEERMGDIESAYKKDGKAEALAKVYSGVVNDALRSAKGAEERVVVRRIDPWWKFWR